MKFAIVAIEGDFRDLLREIASVCGRQPIGEIEYFKDWAAVASWVDEEDCLVAVCSGGWTILPGWDVTVAVFDNPEVGEALVKRFGTRVVTACGHSVSGGCGFRIHSPAGTRSVIKTEEGVVENEGELLPGEEPIEGDAFGLLDVLDTLELLGLDIADGIENSNRCAMLRTAIL